MFVPDDACGSPGGDGCVEHIVWSDTLPAESEVASELDADICEELSSKHEPCPCALRVLSRSAGKRCEADFGVDGALTEIPQVCASKFPTCEVGSSQRVAGAGGGSAEWRFGRGGLGGGSCRRRG